MTENASTDLIAAMQALTQALVAHGSLIAQAAGQKREAAPHPASGLPFKQTARHFDSSRICQPEMLSGSEIRAIREKEHVSQAVFASYLNVSKNLISDWERGAKTPGGPSLRLLTLVKNKGLGVFMA